MRKILFIFIFLSILPAVFAGESEKAEVTNFAGSVSVLLKGEEDYTDAEEGMQLESGDKIKTSASSSAELSFNEENTNLVRLSESTAAEIVLSGDEKVKIDEGELFSSISKLPSGSAFEIRTPTAVSGARGTDWVTKVSDEGTDIEAIDSQPYVRHFETSGAVSKEMTLIKPGQMTTVKKFQKPMQFRPIEQARQKQWQTVKQDVRRRGEEAKIKRQERPAFDRNDFKQKARDKKGQGKAVFKPLQTGQQETQEGFKPMVSGEGKRPTIDQKPMGSEKPMEQNVNQPGSAEKKKPGFKPGQPAQADNNNILPPEINKEETKLQPQAPGQEKKDKPKDDKKNNIGKPQEAGVNNQGKKPPQNIAPRQAPAPNRR